MAFTWPISDPQSIAALRQYIDAANERLAVLGWTSLSVPSAGDIGPQKQIGPELQYWIGAMAPYFVRSHALDGTYLGTGGLDKADPVLPLWTFKDLCQAAGYYIDEDHYGWLRVPAADWPADWTDIHDTAYQWGAIQAGDIRGPWTFRQIERMLKLLLWLPASATTTEEEKKAVSATDPDLATAKASAEAAYASATIQNAGQRGAWSDVHGGGGLDYVAQLERARFKNAATVPNSCKSAVDFYIIPTGDGITTFDGQGDFDPTGRSNKLWYAASGANSDGSGTPATVDVTSPWIGSLTQPAWPAGTPSGNTLNRGYSEAAPPYPYTSAVIRFNVTGGFQYF